MFSAVLKLALSFPAFFIAWYQLAPFANGLIASCANQVVRITGALSALEFRVTAGQVDFVVRTSSLELMLEVEPRLYSWGLPLALSVIFALMPRQPGRSLLLLLAASFAVAVWGVAFDLLAQVVRTTPAYGVFVFGPAAATLVALGYQVGTLLLPPLVPLVIAGGCAVHEGRVLVGGPHV